MKMQPLNELFEVSYGNKFDFNKMQISEKDEKIAFVSRSARNLGVVNYVKKVEGNEPYKEGLITVALGGAILSSFVQQKPFYTAQNIAILKPKREMSFKEKLFYCKCIFLNRFRYSTFGREANKTLKFIMVPDKIPTWVNKIKDNIASIKEPIIKKNFSLKNVIWKDFKIKDLFDIEKGERIIKSNRIYGNTPLITAKSQNNGVVSFLNFDSFKDKKKYFEDKITIDMFFNVFYHNYRYFSDDNVHTLIPKFKQNNKYVSFFLVTVLKKLKYRYNYGRQLRLSRLNLEKIRLPVDNKGEPDYEFMENYIKSLNYSKEL